MKWGQRHATDFPALSQMVRNYFAIPATSVPSERVFSRAGELITKRRNRLSPENANARMCLRAWLNLHELDDEDLQAIGEDDLPRSR